MKILETRSLSYDDVFLIAQPQNEIVSRMQIPCEGNRIIIAGMTSIICPELIVAVSKIEESKRPAMHIVRDQYQQDNLDVVRAYDLQNWSWVGIGLTTTLGDISKLYDQGYRNFLLDLANGYLSCVMEKVKDIKQHFNNVRKPINLICGSVSTAEGFENLQDAGVDIVRSGLGTGSQCITRFTGYSRGALSEIIEMSYCKDGRTKLLADGGIRLNTIAKAFAAGADYTMSGGLFIDAAEARMRVDGSNIYYGQASAYGKEAMGKEKRNIEGKFTKLSTENVRPLSVIVDEVWDLLRSTVSYSGYATLTDFINDYENKNTMEVIHHPRS